MTRSMSDRAEIRATEPSTGRRLSTRLKEPFGERVGDARSTARWLRLVRGRGGTRAWPELAASSPRVGLRPPPQVRPCRRDLKAGPHPEGPSAFERRGPQWTGPRR